MEFTGDEKKIQALFSELSLEHQRRTPAFEKLWSRADKNARVPAPLVRTPAFAIVMAVILAAAGVIAASSWYRSSQSENAANIPPQVIPATTEPRTEQRLSAVARDIRTVPPRRVRPRQTERVALREAATLAKWQSPTNVLLNSPAVSFLGSLPQLDQSARDLEQFLPKNNDVMKESKQ